jgi:putative transposase
VLHVLNRSAKRAQLFFNDQDYCVFENLLRCALVRTPTRLLAYCLMPNHWHLVLWVVGNEIPCFMHWLTLTHAKQWHKAHGTAGTGYVYQNRYRAIPVQTDTHLLTLLRYVERNPLRACLVARAEEWRWGSLWRRCNFRDDDLLSPWPLPRPENWLEIVNIPETIAELEAIREAVKRNRPIGEPEWSAEAARLVKLVMGGAGRPAKPNRV